MQAFVAMLLTLRVGLVPGPGAAVQSIRAECLQAAHGVVARDRFVGPELAPVRSLSMLRSRHATRTPDGWAPPPIVVTNAAKEDWRDLIADTLNGNQKIANAVMWLAAAPVRLRVSPERVFVAITLQTP